MEPNRSFRCPRFARSITRFWLAIDLAPNGLSPVADEGGDGFEIIIDDRGCIRVAVAANVNEPDSPGLIDRQFGGGPSGLFRSICRSVDHC